MSLHTRIVNSSIHHPRLTILAALVFAVALGMQIPRLTIDTDPENMLSKDETSRVFHNQTRDTFNLSDMIVVGVVNETHSEGVFNATSLTRLHDLTRHVEQIDGVITHDLMSLATVDNISQDSPGVVRFEWMMDHPPASDAEALVIRDNARNLHTINGTLVSEDGKVAVIYVPIENKNDSHRISEEIQAFIGGLEGEERYYITGLPVAEETFGVEMFKQMGIAAPMAGFIIFILMWVFFRSLSLITAPMLVAVITVSATMGLLVALGFPVHIMSSMIPIFLMPIAVVDSIHILSEFADLYPRMRDRKKTMQTVMGHLFKPMYFTSLTSAAGFASLALAPIPPVRVFGLFVAFGILLAFLLTVTFIPAYVVLLNDKNLSKMLKTSGSQEHDSLLARILRPLGARALSQSRVVIGVTVLILGVSAFGISRIEINDNPVRWFRPNHPIRVSDRILNEHFSGTYSAFLVLEKSSDPASATWLKDVQGVLTQSSESNALAAAWETSLDQALKDSPENPLPGVMESVEDQLDLSEGAAFDAWDEILTILEDAQIADKFFQSPEALAYIEGLQGVLATSGLVGKSNSLVDIVKTVHRELRDGDKRYFSIPGTSPGVAQTLLTYQSSHRPHDLWHFVTPDFRQTNLWLQLKSGDNKDMSAVTELVDQYVLENPPPEGVTLNWAGLTYINVVWQDAMVGGMLSALLGSFVIVFIMMLVLFRSFWFGLLAMLPLSVTIAFIYGAIGLMGKDYDMPVAILSSLTLGLSVDFAIHFLQRARTVHDETGDWRQTMHALFEEPARAISRNAIVISVGFLPLLGSPLIPYNTVGLFLAAIMIISAFVTLLLLPSVMKHIRTRLFKETDSPTPSGSSPGVKTFASVIGAGLMLLATTGVASAQSSADLIDVNTIITRADHAAYYAANDGRAIVRMTITDAKGRERKRQFTILRKDREDGGDQDYVVLFSRPADVRNTVFLVKKHVGKDDDRWLYLPDLDLVKRIAGGDRRTSFVGSNFFYEDVSGRGVNEDIHTLVETTADHYVIRNVPKNPGSVEFSEWTAWVDKTTFLPTKMEYTNDAGNLYRRIETLEIQDVDGFPTVTKMKVSDLQSGGYTISEFRGVEYNLNIPDDIFTERTLRNPSREWFKKR